MVKILSIDPGTKRVGLAACDELGVSTRLLPVLTFKSLRGLVQQLVELIQKEAFKKVIIGLPLNMDGTESEASRRSKNLATALEKGLEEQNLDARVLLWDERLTSYEAETRLREYGIAKKKAKEYLDSLAAEVLLQDYLSSSEFKL